MKVLVLLSLFTVVLCELTQWEKYKGHKMYATTPTRKDQVLQLRQLQEEIWQINFISEAVKPGHEVLVIVPQEFRDHVTEKFESIGLKYHVQVEEMGQYVEKYWADLWESRDSQKAYDINGWNTYEDIMTEMDAMVARCPFPLTCDTYVAGQSYEGRDMKVLRIRSGSNKQIIWMDSMIHCREWLAGTTVLKIMDTLTRNYNSDATVKRLIDNFDWYFLPVMNPDGYTYTWDVNGDRMWRKSRTIHSDSWCLGTDLNRNYEYFWNTGGASPSPCSDTYRGSAAGSEPETQVAQAEARKIADSTAAWISVHTAANMLLSPWGYTDFGRCQFPEDNEDLLALADIMCNAIARTFNTVWFCGNWCEVLYASSGTTIDYAKSLGIKYAYTPELRGPGFDPGVGNIQPGFEEFYNGVIAMADTLASRKS